MVGLYPKLIEIAGLFLEGNSLVTIFTKPPVKSAGKSAVKDLIIWTLSNMLVGNKSIWMVFLSGSNPGISMSFNMDLVYLSPSPRTYTYLPPIIETPGALFMALAKLLEPTFLKASEERPSIKLADFFCIINNASSVFFWTETETTTSSRPTDDEERLTLISFTSFSLTIISVSSLVL